MATPISITIPTTTANTQKLLHEANDTSKPWQLSATIAPTGTGKSVKWKLADGVTNATLTTDGKFNATQRGAYKVLATVEN
jgi:hypothetical protein